jgi:zinc protease
MAPKTGVQGESTLSSLETFMTKQLRLLPLLLLLLLFSTGCQPLNSALMDQVAEREPAADIGIDLTDFSAVLPVDPNLRYGQLENGLTYYVKRNTEPTNRAELWLAVDAGSVLEDEDQLGLAHFLEHMLFKGTERFPENSLIDFFETVGMTFGPDINAYTSFDETVYMLRFPTNDEEIVKTAFEVLEDWAGYAIIDPKDVDAERGVIIEEERLRMKTAQGRVWLDQVYPALLEGSLYAERLPIGDMDVVRNATAETLRRYYEDWYRPDLMAVIAVGDFDPDLWEALVREHFSQLPQPEDPRPRPTFAVPDHDETRYLIIRDPEFPSTLIEIAYKQDAEEGETVGDYRELLIQSLFNYLFNFRLNEISRQADSPFVGAYYNRGSMVRGVDTIDIGAQVQDEEILSGMEAILLEVERIRRHGFTDSELTRAKDTLRSTYRRMYNNRDNWESESFAREYIRNFTTGEPIPGIEIELRLAEALLPGISLEEVNGQVESLVGEENRTVLVVAPDKADVDLPTEAELSALIDSIEALAIDPYEDIEAEGDLVAEIPARASIISESTIPELNITEIELENGVRVIMKPTDFTQQVVFAGISPGGSSLVADEDHLEARWISSIVMESGLGNLERNEIIRLLSGKGVNVRPRIDEIEESISGAAPPDELEALFQLIYLYFTAPRADEAALSTFQNQIRAFLRNRDLTPSAALQDALIRARYGDSPRYRMPTLEEVENLDLERAFEIYQERFADASDFTFIFVGDFNVRVVTSFAQIYLGNLPTLDREERWQNVQPMPPDGVIKETVYRGQDPRSTTYLLFVGPTEVTDETALQLRAIQGALDILLVEDLRDRRSGVYGIGASAYVDTEPDELYNASISFVSDPERVDELVDAIFDLIAQLQTEGPSETLMTKATAQILRNHEEDLEDNFFWLDLLSAYALDPEADPREVLRFEEQVRGVTAEAIQAAAQEFLRQDRYIQVVLHPESYRQE